MDPVTRIRRFNRAVTQHTGVLNGHYLGRNRSFAACRLLFEIGAKGAEVRELRTRLDLDSGYVSRLLRGLEREGMVRTTPGTADARVRRVVLSPAGRAELGVLNRLSNRSAQGLLDRLTEGQRGALVAGMETVERLLLAAAVELKIVPPGHPAARACLAAYFAELRQRFDQGFDPGRSIPTPPRDFTPPHGYFVVAMLRGTPVGCGSMRCHTDWGELKRMWVAPSSRGLGIGRRILEHLEDLAGTRGLKFVRLETNRALEEAQALYRQSGYREVAPFNQEPYAHHWFEKRLRSRRRG